MVVVVVAVIVLVGALVVASLGAVMGYNRLQRSRQAVAEAWAQIDTQLQRRFDLIGSLNEVVSAATRHERLTLVAVTQGRDPSVRSETERQLQGQGTQLLASAEAYPLLRTDERFARLHQQLVRTEDDVAASRRYYNGRVRQLNTTRQTFPWSLVATALRVGPAPYFQVELDHASAPRVS